MRLLTLSLDVPALAAEAYIAALESVCGTVGFFIDEAAGLWRIEGVRDAAAPAGPLAAALALAEAATGVTAALSAIEVPADGWLARTAAAFPEQVVGRRFLLRGTHLPAGPAAGRLVLLLDAGVAFGSGEHESTRGCLRALEQAVVARPRRILDIGTGSGVLALAAALLLRRPVLATDNDPWAVRTARANAALNRQHLRVRATLATGYRHPAIAAGAPYDLVFANILARPLCAMAHDLAAHLAPGGTAILAGLLSSQARMVLAAHRRVGLVLIRRIGEGPWATLMLRKPGAVR